MNQLKLKCVNNSLETIARGDEREDILHPLNIFLRPSRNDVGSPQSDTGSAKIECQRCFSAVVKSGYLFLRMKSVSPHQDMQTHSCLPLWPGKTRREEIVTATPAADALRFFYHSLINLEYLRVRISKGCAC